MSSFDLLSDLSTLKQFVSYWLFGLSLAISIFYHYIGSVQIKSSYYYSYQTPTHSVVSEKKTVLNSVSGLFRKNQVGAILGCSGSGKSTLMNILSGYM